MEWNAARGQNDQPGTDVEEPTHDRRPFDDLLQVVEDEEQLPIAQVIGEGFDRFAAGLLAQEERPRDRRRYLARIGDRAQVGYVDAVGEPPELLGCDLQGQPSLADSPRPREG
jgi:hypothetical protein